LAYIRMRTLDPIAKKQKLSQETFIYTALQSKGQRKTQQDYVGNINDELFVVADGVGSMPHADTAAILGGETAIWGYKHIRLRPFYWADKLLLIKRIFRSSNITVWQKRRESGFENGLASTLSIAIIGSQKIWVGSVGDTSIFLYREGLIDYLTPVDINKQGMLTNALGLKRYGLVPHVAVDKFLSGDILCIATDGVVNYVSEEEFRGVLETISFSTESITAAAEHLLHIAEDHGSKDNMTVCLIKRIR
jgi:serine/threonine protein phosphatase PrpC